MCGCSIPCGCLRDCSLPDAVGAINLPKALARLERRSSAEGGGGKPETVALVSMEVPGEPMDDFASPRLFDGNYGAPAF